MTAERNQIVGRDVLERLERVENCLALLLGSGVGRAAETALGERVIRVERQMAVAMGTVAAGDDTEADSGEEPARRFSLDHDCVEADGRTLSRAIADELSAIERRYSGTWHMV
jgi:hypothetical protein